MPSPSRECSANSPASESSLAHAGGAVIVTAAVRSNPSLAVDIGIADVCAGVDSVPIGSGGIDSPASTSSDSAPCVGASRSARLVSRALIPCQRRGEVGETHPSLGCARWLSRAQGHRPRSCASPLGVSRLPPAERESSGDKLKRREPEKKVLGSLKNFERAPPPENKAERAFVTERARDAGCTWYHFNDSRRRAEKSARSWAQRLDGLRGDRSIDRSGQGRPAPYWPLGLRIQGNDG